MDDAPAMTSLPDDPKQLKALLAAREGQLAARERVIAEHQNTIASQEVALVQHQHTLAAREQVIAQHQNTIAAITQQRDAYYLEKLRLEVRLAKALKQAYGPRADRIADPGQFLLEFAGRLDAVPIDPADLPADGSAGQEKTGPTSAAAAAESHRMPSRRLRTRGRRDIGSLDHLPQIEQTSELTGALCRCPTCQAERVKIGGEVSYTIEHIPAALVRVKHVRHKYVCRHCEQNGDNPNIALAAKTGGSPIDKGMPGPGLLAYVATAKFSDFLPLNRLQNIFAREGFELDRSTLCLWMADVAQLLRPLYRRMIERVKQSHVLATDDTIMPLLAPGKARQARMWIYQGDESNPYNVFDFTPSRARDGPARFLKDFRGTLLADAYGGYDGIVLNQDLPRAGCWSHARRKFVDAEPTAPEAARAILALLNRLFKAEARINDELQAQRSDEAEARRSNEPQVPRSDAAAPTISQAPNDAGLPPPCAAGRHAAHDRALHAPRNPELQALRNGSTAGAAQDRYAERLHRRQTETRPILAALQTLLLEQKEKLLPKHPLALAIAYTLNQWQELTLFLEDGAVPIHNNLAEQQMKRIALLRKNALFVATPRGGETAAILSSFTSTCRRHEINPQAYLTQLFANLPDTPISQLDPWLPDQWKAARTIPPAPPPE